MKNPIFTDDTIWHSDICKWLRLMQLVYEIEMKNHMEGFFLTDHKIECLIISFPLKRNYDKHEIYNELV